MDHKIFCDILNSEMVLATGCTEPAAIALCAATARAHLKGEIADLTVLASVNIIKNAMSAGIPGTKYTGIDYAAALGATGGKPELELMVVDHTTKEERDAAVALVQGGHVKMGKKVTPEKLYVEVELHSRDGHQARAIIARAHTNVIHIEEDGKVIEDRSAESVTAGGVPVDVIDRTLTIHSIFEFVNELDRSKDDLHMIEQAIRINSQISKVGSEGDYGLNIGRVIAKARDAGKMGNSLVTNAMAAAASGADARMAGASVPVVTNSGSGNQGITTTMPIVSAAKTLGIDEDKMFRAVTFSNLMGIHIHCRFGLLSALCGATVAGTGASCGLVYMMGGTEKQIGYAVNNMLGAVSGMLCDGAKADCALKISTCTSAAFQCAFMALDDVCVQPSDGIVEADPEKTIRNFVRLGNEGSEVMDNIVLDEMMSKKQ